jgi:hypothetical protein
MYEYVKNEQSPGMIRLKHRYLPEYITGLDAGIQANNIERF